MNSRVTRYVVVVVLAAIIAISGLAFYASDVSVTLAEGALAFATMGLVAQALVYSMPTGSNASISFLPFLTAVVLYPSWITITMVAVATGLAELRQRKINVKRAFNVAQLVVATSAAAVTYVAFGGRSIQIDPSFRFVPHSAAVGAFLIVNTGLVAGVLALSSDRKFLDVWRQNTRATIAYDLLAIPIVFWCALLYAKLGWNGVAFVFIVMSGTRQFYQKNRLLEIAYEETLEVLVGAVELRDPYTSGHSHRVRKYSTIIASALGLSTKQSERIGVAALLHDVGKIDGIFVPILQKPGRLTDEERATMELHPIKSAELVARASQLADIIPTIRHHHEDWDGTGYPDGLAGQAIPIGSRIIRFADTIDAMTTDRPYRKALGESEVQKELLKHRGTQFDPNIYDVLVASPEFARIFDKNDDGRLQSLTQVFDRVRRRAKLPKVA